jgi:hypothetical protein
MRDTMDFSPIAGLNLSTSLLLHRRKVYLRAPQRTRKKSQLVLSISRPHTSMSQSSQPPSTARQQHLEDIARQWARCPTPITEAKFLRTLSREDRTDVESLIASKRRESILLYNIKRSNDDRTIERLVFIDDVTDAPESTSGGNK